MLVGPIGDRLGDLTGQTAATGGRPYPVAHHTWVMTSVASVVGAALVLVVLWDVFHTLWYPAASGRLSRLAMAGIWRLSGGGRPLSRTGTLTGPLSLLVVVLTWCVLTVVGWALVYWPHVPESFSFDIGLPPSERADLLDALYISLVTLATLGFGDIVPTAGWLRIAVPLEALIGFAILTAAVSWGLQLYPALSRRRVLAIRLDLLGRADAGERRTLVESSSGPTLLLDLSTAVIQARVDVTQYAETYYFGDPDPASSLPATIGHAAHLAELGTNAVGGDVRLAAHLLGSAVADFAHVVDEEFVHVRGSTADVLAAYAKAHGRPPAAGA